MHASNGLSAARANVFAQVTQLLRFTILGRAGVRTPFNVDRTTNPAQAAVRRATAIARAQYYGQQDPDNIVTLARYAAEAVAQLYCTQTWKRGCATGILDRTMIDCVLETSSCEIDGNCHLGTTAMRAIRREKFLKHSKLNFQQSFDT